MTARVVPKLQLNAIAANNSAPCPGNPSSNAGISMQTEKYFLLVHRKFLVNCNIDATGGLVP